MRAFVFVEHSCTRFAHIESASTGSSAHSPGYEIHTQEYEQYRAERPEYSHKVSSTLIADFDRRFLFRGKSSVPAVYLLLDFVG